MEWFNILGNMLLSLQEWDKKININLMYVHLVWSGSQNVVNLAYQHL